MPTKPEPRYRVSVTAKVVATIMDKLITPDNFKQPEVQEVLALFSAVNKKIATGTMQPHYTSVAKESLEESLGMIETVSSIANDFGTDRTFDGKEEYWAWCYEQMQQQGSKLNEKYLEGAYEHMYLNGLMNEEMEDKFEAGELLP